MIVSRARGFACVCIFLMIAAGCGLGDSSTGGSEVAVGERPIRPLLFVGLDGAEWDVIEPMIEQGELPNLARLIDQGALSHLITPIQSVSPVVWTTFLTGHFPRHHGILDFVYPYDEGEGKRPVESEQRQKPAIWNLLSAEGKTVKVVGFFASHPSDEVTGTMVSDRAFSDPSGGFWPASLADRYSSEEFFAGPARKEALRRFFTWPGYFKPPSSQTSAERSASELVTGRVSGRVIGDSYLRSVASALSDEPWDFYGIYFRIPDVASHSLWLYLDDSDFEEKANPEIKKLVGDIIPEAYRFVDEAIGELVAEAGSQANIIVVSDHGFGSSTGQYQVHDKDLKMLTGNHRPDGIFIGAGPDIVPGNFPGLTVLDVMPLMMALLGQPVANELPGQVDVNLIDPDFLKAHPIREISQYNTDWRSNDAAIDPEEQARTLETLRALGYVENKIDVIYTDPVSDYDFWDSSDDLISANLHGEVVYFLLRGDQARALQVLEETAIRKPEVLASLIRHLENKVKGIRAERITAGVAAPGFENFIDSQRERFRSALTAKPARDTNPTIPAQSVIDFVKNPETSKQIVSGFYKPEGSGWRWMGPKGVVRLIVPESATEWRVEGWANLRAYDGEPLAISVALGGGEAQSFAILENGNFSATGSLIAESGTEIMMDLRCDRSFRPAQSGTMDERDLCVVVRRIELH